MKRFIALSALLAGSLVAFSFDAAAGDGGALILSKNPQLSKIPDWPQVTGVGEPADCNKAGMQESVDSMRKRGETAYRCVVVQVRFGGQPWESGSGGSGLYQLHLHPNSPMVWRVNKIDQVRLIALIAEFDATGKLLFSQSARSPTKLLTDAQGNSTPQTAQPAKKNKLTTCARNPTYANLTDADVKKTYEAALASNACKISSPGTFTLEGTECRINLTGISHELVARGMAPYGKDSYCK